MKHTLLRYSLAGLFILAAGLGFVFATAAILASYNSAQNARRAYSLVSFNADYAARLAGWDSDRHTSLLLKAVHSNPYQIQALLQLGFDAEFRSGDLRQAEAYYRQAAAVDKMFLPKWTLANFYFREGRRADFLHWAREALSVTPYSADPIFAELWVLADDDGARNRTVPNRPAILDQYLMFLFRTQHWGTLPPVLDRLVRSAGPNSAGYGLSDIIGPMLDRLLTLNLPAEAFAMWTSLSRAHWIAGAVPDSSHPLLNGDFIQPIWGHGLDWLPMNHDGVLWRQDIAQKRIQFSLNGDQGEDVMLLGKWLPLEPGQLYRLTWTSDVAEALGKPSGVSWRLQSGDIFTDSPDWAGSDVGYWAFANNGTAKLSLLSLHYRRAPGTTRAQGTFRVSAISLQKP